MVEVSSSTAGWGGLALLLFITTFGPYAGVYLSLYLSSFLLGGLTVIFIYGKVISEKFMESCEQCSLPPASHGIKMVAASMKPEEKAQKWDRRLTGSSSIDDPLQQVLQYALRDYVQCWYYELSDEESFLTEIRQIAQRALVTLSNRCKDVDWQPYLTTRLVDDFASHLRVYRKALHKLEEEEEEDDEDEEEEEEEEEPQPQHTSGLILKTSVWYLTRSLDLWSAAAVSQQWIEALHLGQ